MTRTDLFIKVELWHEDDERLDRVVAEICRQVGKVYCVRSVEMSSAVSRESD